MPMKLREFARALSSRQDEMTDLLREFVELESGSYDKAAVDRIGVLLSSRFTSLGFSVDRLHEETTGDHLVATRRGAGEGRLLVLIHLDTVWPTGTLAEIPFEIVDGRATG